MSASVFKPIHPLRMDLQRQFTPSFVEQKLRGDINKVRRALFGPINHHETQLLLDTELRNHALQKSQEYEFDFRREVPFSPTGRTGRFIWEPVRLSPQKITFAPKRKRSLEEDIDNSHLYSHPLDEVKRPHPLRADESSRLPQAPLVEAVEKKQLKITDFMNVRKRPAGSAFVKKLSPPRPSKITRESHCS